MQIRTYATFKEMHGYESTLDDLISRLRPFSRKSVLFACSVTGIILQLWKGNDWAKELYAWTIDEVFDPLRADWYKLAFKAGEHELVFHRRQLLLLLKLAVEHCPEHGLDLMRAPRWVFGTILLMANDQFHFGLFPNPAADENDEYDKISRLVAEFIPINEFGASAWEFRITRSHLLMTRYTNQLRGHRDFIDIPAEYERLSGLALPDYEALTFGLLARITVMMTFDALRRNTGVAVIRPENFGTTIVPRPTIDAFLREYASTSQELLAAIRRARANGKDFGTNDFTELKKRPLISGGYGSLATDVNLVIAKFDAGPYWRVNYISTATGDKLRKFWGAVFEVYVNDLIRNCARPSSAVFIPDPHEIDNPNAQVCDGLLIEGDSLVVMEYKASMFTAEAKYSGNHIALRDEITKKLVRDAAENKKKGVEQIAAAIKSIFSQPQRRMVEGLDALGIRRVYPLLITLDEIGSSLLISKLLNFSFKPEGAAGVEVKPLLCTDIESLEKVLPYMDVKPLSGFLQFWLDGDPLLLKTLLSQFPENLPERRNEFLAQELTALKSGLGARLFT
jgi:hypothetical protein